MDATRLTALNMRTFTGSAFQPAAPQETSVAFTITGQMIRGIHTCQTAPTLIHEMLNNGFDPKKLHILATSSGALAALCVGLNDAQSSDRGVQTQETIKKIEKFWLQFVSQGGKSAISRTLRDNLTLIPRWVGAAVANGVRRKPIPSFPSWTPFRKAIEDAMQAIQDNWSFGNKNTGFDRIVSHPARMTLVTTEAQFKGKARPIVSSAFKALLRGLHYAVTTDPETVSQKIRTHVDTALEAAHNCFQPIYAVKPSEPTADIGTTLRTALPIRSGADMRAATEATICIPGFYTPGFQGLPFGGRQLFDGVWSEGAPIEEALKQGATEVFVFNDGVAKNGSFAGNVRQREVLAQVVSNSQAPTIARWLERGLKAIRLDKIPYLRRAFHAVAGFRQVAERATRPEDLQTLLESYPKARIHVVGLPPSYPADKVDPVVGRFIVDDPSVITTAYNSGSEQVEAILEILAEGREVA